MRRFAAYGFAVASILLLSPSLGFTQSSDFDPSSGSYDVDAPERRGQAGMTWLRIGGSARIEGMGGASIGLKEEPSSATYNPAGAASLDGISFYTNSTRWPGDVRANHFAVFTNIGAVTAGAQFQSMDFGAITGTVIEDISSSNRSGYRETGEVGVSAYTAGLVLAANVTDRFAAGVTFKNAVEDVEGSSLYSFLTGQQGYSARAAVNRVSVWAIDIGTQYNTGLRNLSINMSFLNLAPTVSYVEQDFDLPLTYQVGFSFDAVEILTGSPIDGHDLRMELVGVDRRDVPLDAAIGVEYATRVTEAAGGLELALRAGRRPAHNQDAQFGFGCGVSGVFSGIKAQIDYSYNDYGPLFDAQRLSLAIFLDN